MVSQRIYLGLKEEREREREREREDFIFPPYSDQTLNILLLLVAQEILVQYDGLHISSDFAIGLSPL